MPHPDPDEKLTATQLSILQAVWAQGDAGATVAAIWDALGRDREVARTTVLTQVQRLEKRGWLRRSGDPGIATYTATVAREQVERRLARRFVADFFAGSAAGLVKSLLGSGRVDRDELRALKEIVARAERSR
jgi:predicted transcriptional regulator